MAFTAEPGPTHAEMLALGRPQRDLQKDRPLPEDSGFISHLKHAHSYHSSEGLHLKNLSCSFLPILPNIPLTVFQYKFRLAGHAWETPLSLGSILTDL